MSDKSKEILSSVGSFLGGVAVLVGAIWGINWLSNRPDTTKTNTTSTQNQSGSDSLYFANCTDARNAGYENIAEGSPGYRPELDRDGDGLACEPYTP